MENMNKRKVGGILMIVAILFGISETIYFGSNWWPASHAELICDYITVFIFVIGAAMIKLNKN